MNQDGRLDRSAVDLRGYLAVIRNRKWTVVVVTLLAIVAALGIGFIQTPIYKAESTLLIEQTAPEFTNEPTSAQIDLNTEREVVASEPVAERVVKNLELDLPVEVLLRDLSVEALLQTDVLLISYSSPNRGMARDVANEFATAYVDYRQDEALADLQDAQRAVQKRIEGVEERLADVEKELSKAQDREDRTASAASSAQASSLASQLEVLREQLDAIQPDQQSKQVGGEVLKSASLPRKPASPNMMRNGILGAFLGLTLGLGLAFLRERLYDRFRDRAEVERAVNAPVLATIPRYPHKRRQFEIVLLNDAHSPASEAYRRLRANFQLIAVRGGLKSLLVTSPSAAEGKTSTSCNLAVALAQAGSSVVVVAADMRRPTLEEYFEIERVAGLSTWLAGDEEDLGSLVVKGPIENLHILPTGPVPSNPAELLSGPMIRAGLTALEKDYDYVIFDSPPTLPVADAVLLAAAADATLLVVAADQTKPSAAVHARDELQRDQATVVGCVLNSFDPAAHSEYGYGYYRYESHSQEPDGEGSQTPRRRFSLKR